MHPPRAVGCPKNGRKAQHDAAEYKIVVAQEPTEVVVVLRGECVPAVTCAEIEVPKICPWRWRFDFLFGEGFARGVVALIADALVHDLGGSKYVTCGITISNDLDATYL